MNNYFKREEQNAQKLGKKYGNLIKDIVIVAILALVLLFSAWKIFRGDSRKETIAQSTATENEKRVARILEQIDGVGEADVIVCENENGVQSVVVVCEGAKNFSVVLHIREAVAAALDTEQSAVKIYLKKQ